MAKVSWRQGSPIGGFIASAVTIAALAAGMAALPVPGLAQDELSMTVQGGRLYDNWYKVTDENPPLEPHPAYPAGGKFSKDSKATWRCVECHGWDYRGRDGAYGEGEHNSGIKGITGMAGADPALIVALLKDDNHLYGDLLDEGELQALALFVSRGQVDMDEYIYRPSRLSKGDPGRRVEYYQTICANCHGRDGMEVRTIPPLGSVSNDNPWRAFHNIVNGHPGETMPALRIFGMDVLTDILAYVQTLPSEELVSSIARGGRLYDNWVKETNAKAPIARHPAYPESGKSADDFGTTWRCKECHGWDYMGRDGAYGKGAHFTGIIGIQGMAGVAPSKILDVLGDATHDLVEPRAYRGLMDYHDLLDLANFISLGQVDMDRYIVREGRVVKGDKDRRIEYYQTICASCHGRDGLAIASIPPLGLVARENPWEALHKVLNGHPGESTAAAGSVHIDELGRLIGGGHPQVTMPPLRSLGIDVLVDILAYIQTLPVQETLASIIRGGRLYDRWYKEIGAPEPTTRHPSYPAGMMYAGEPKNNWRCKECHGWDYKGRDGAYGKGDHFTGIAGIQGMAGATAEDIIAVLEDDVHGYGDLIGYQGLRDLANFISLGQVDMDQYIDRTSGLAKGDAGKQVALFSSVCANCHGPEGLKMNNVPPLGKVAKSNPWEALHKLFNGHPNENMPALRVLDPQVLVDMLAFVQTLPSEM